VAIAEVESLLQDTRSLTFEISSPLLYEVGLEPALESLAERMLLPKGIAFDFQEYGPRAVIDTNSGVLIYQMTQELLLNVIKHSKATHVVLRVQRGKKRILVFVEDNGKGFAAEAGRRWGEGSGLGLFSIRERLYSLGGELKILSEKGQGCTVSIIVPLTSAGGAGDENPNLDD
jgi:signal transduction histidine kinase